MFLECRQVFIQKLVLWMSTNTHAHQVVGGNQPNVTSKTIVHLHHLLCAVSEGDRKVWIYKIIIILPPQDYFSALSQNYTSFLK